MKSIIVVLAVTAVLIKSSRCNQCKESDFTPCPNFDIKKMVGRWYYIRYDDKGVGVSTCDYSDISYNPCKDKYSIKYHRFIKDEEETQEGWIDIPLADVGIWDVKYAFGEQRAFIIDFDYDKYFLARGCYGNKCKAFFFLFIFF